MEQENQIKQEQSLFNQNEEKGIKNGHLFDSKEEVNDSIHYDSIIVY